MPVAVAPVMKRGGRMRAGAGADRFGAESSGGIRLGGTGALQAGKFPEENRPGGEDEDAHKLRGSGDASEVMDWVIAPERFDHGAGDRVAKQIRREDLAIKFFAPKQPGEPEIEDQTEQGIVDLAGMNVMRKGRVVGGITDRPGQ